jgi:hypothetical protein
MNSLNLFVTLVPFLSVPYVYYYNFVNCMIGDLFSGSGGLEDNDGAVE